MFQWLKKLFPRERAHPAPKREIFLYCGEGTGDQQVGRVVNIGGRQGRVVEGTGLTITVEWEEPK